jgi:hypothetical protein
MSKHQPNLRLNTVRASVSFPAADYAELERIASRKRVSVAWVVRDAVSKYLTMDAPLFGPVADSEEGERAQ